ncbi:MAG: hypothetical protein IJE22_03265 [Oscillibacter sp.]|nr:hypothetical protein [Oscillibacter sp.]
MKTCFMFGHSNTPPIHEALIQALETAYHDHGIRRFVVGSRGDFDRQRAIPALRYLKEKYDDLEIQRLIAYHPALGRGEAIDVPDVFDSTYYPEGMENVPLSYCIRRANERMVTEAELIICYVAHFGNTRSLLEYAERKKIPCLNLARPAALRMHP